MIHTPKYLFQNKDNHGDAPAISIKDSNGNWQTDSWNDYLNSVTSVAKSLLAAGIQKNDKVKFVQLQQKRVELLLFGNSVDKWSSSWSISHLII